MPIAGVICGYDKSFQPFQHCIDCHERFAERNCHAPVELLKIMRDNKKKRSGAGWSASTLTGCPRAAAMLEVYDYYEPLISGWNKARGEWWHSVLESDPDPAPGVFKERRIYRTIEIDGEDVTLTGRPDTVYTLQGVLMDGKSKEKLPKKPDPAHEAQFNVYVWLLADGFFHDTGEPVKIKIVRGGMHYVTWRTKEIDAFLKMAYPIWELEDTKAFVIERLAPLVVWRKTGNLPRCDPYIKGRWDCDCVKITKQLTQRGIAVEEWHDATPHQ